MESRRTTDANDIQDRRAAALVRQHQVRLAGVEDKNRQEARLLARACLPADSMTIAGELGPALASPIHRLRPFVDLADDRAFEDGRVNERGRGHCHVRTAPDLQGLIWDGEISMGCGHVSGLFARYDDRWP